MSCWRIFDEHEAEGGKELVYADSPDGPGIGLALMSFGFS